MTNGRLWSISSPPTRGRAWHWAVACARFAARAQAAEKGGGYRTLYVFGGIDIPLFLLTVFAKNEKDNLSKAEQAAAVQLSKALLETYGELQ